jgi:Domain of unknown function (DUF4432)
MRLFGKERSREELARLVPDITRLAGIRQLREENGAGSGQRLIRIESGGGLSVELFPDRTCDIGQVWCDGTPFCWTGPIGAATPAVLRGSTPLSGLMTACGFDHIRQPESDDGGHYPQHGSMMHQPATILAAEAMWKGDNCTFRVSAEATSFTLERGAVRLRRTIEVPLGGRSLRLNDEVTVLAGALPLMAMYHVNLGFPLAGPDSRLTLSGDDVTDACLGSDGVRTCPAGHGIAAAELAGGPNVDAPRFALSFDADALPVFQTLRNMAPGINLICLEPATHERLPRAELRKQGLLDPLPAGTVRRFALDFHFHPGGPRSGEAP